MTIIFKKLTTSHQVIERNFLVATPFSGEIVSETPTTKFFVVVGEAFTNNLYGKGVVAGSANNAIKLKGNGVVIETPGFRSLTHNISTIDPAVPGDLSYIDGCSNTNLVSAGRNGDPCLNYLYFPPGIEQTFHTHPSVRVGIVLSGSGTAWIKKLDGIEKIPLAVGDVFILDRFGEHRFSTDNDHLSLIAFHPDSEDGPRDELNPMKTRTYLK